MNGDNSVIRKITRPHFASTNHLSDLHNLLDEAHSRRLVVVSGPPGIGKSTLVSTYIENRKLPSVWYQIDKDDNDPLTFFHFFGIAVSGVTPHNNPAMPYMTPEFSEGVAAFAKLYFGTLYRHLESPFLIVLDNYQDIAEGADLHEAIRVACTELPEGGRIVIITRKECPSAMASLRAGNMAAIIESDDLRLSPRELMPWPACTT